MITSSSEQRRQLHNIFCRRRSSVLCVLAWQHQICAGSSRVIGGSAPLGVPRKAGMFPAPHAIRPRLLVSSCIPEFTLPIRPLGSLIMVSRQPRNFFAALARPSPKYAGCGRRASWASIQPETPHLAFGGGVVKGRLLDAEVNSFIQSLKRPAWGTAGP